MKLNILLLMFSLKANHPCLNQFVLLCPSYLFLSKPSLNWTATFFDAFKLFSIILLIAEPVSLPHPRSRSYPQFHPCMCCQEQFSKQVGTLFEFSFFFLHPSENVLSFKRYRVQTKNQPLKFITTWFF